MEKISARANAKIKYACSLKEASARKRERRFLIEGSRLCRDAVLSGINIVYLFITSKQLNSQEADYLIDNSESVYEIEEHVADKLADTKNSQGVFAVCDIPDSSVDFDLNGKYVLLENIQNPGNLGAVLRTAEALGASGAVLSGCCDMYSPKALRAAMGSAFRVPAFYPEDKIGFLRDKIKSGMKLYCCVVDKGAENIKNVDKSGGVILAIGNEGNGLSDEIKAEGTSVTIVMKGNAESLNAAGAANIALYEILG